MNNQRKQIEEKLREQESIRQRRQVIQSIIDVKKSIQQLNELDDAINLSKYIKIEWLHFNNSLFFYIRIDMNEMIERAVVQFSFISIQLEKCGENEPAMESLKLVRNEFCLNFNLFGFFFVEKVIENLRRVFEKRLTTAFIDAYREPNMTLLADSLKGLASISLQTIAEQTFANEIVRPYMEKVKRTACFKNRT